MISPLQRSLSKARSNTHRGTVAGRMLATRAAGGFSGMESQFAGGGGNGALGSLAGIIADGGGRKTEKLYGTNRDWVYVILAAISKRVSGLPYGAGTISRNKSKTTFAATKKYAPLRLPKTIKNRTAGGRAIEQLETHPALDFLNKPNRLQGKTEFLQITILNLFLTGEFYWVGGKSGDGEYEMWAVPTAWMTPKHDGGLFTSFIYKMPGMAEGKELPRDVVIRKCFPDPADFKRSINPVSAESRAVRIDEYIQTSQEQAFERGPFPTIALEVGDRKDADGRSLGPPTLTGAQRRQYINAIREVWRQQTANGDPAILDGLIKQIHKLQTSNQEMDWMQSGEQVKKRLFQAFGLNPYIVGDQLPGSRAQSAVAESNYVDNAINPLVDMISCALQDFVVPMFDGDEDNTKGMALWLEEAKPKDEELDMRKISQARQGGSASRNEERAVLGLPALESPSADAVGLIATAAGIAQAQSLVVAVTSGQLPKEAAAVLMGFLGLDENTVTEMLAKAKPQPMLGQPGGPPAAGNLPGPQGSPDPKKPPVKPPKDDDEPPNAPALADQGGDSGKSLVPTGKTMPRLTRSMVKSHNVELRTRLEREAAVGLTPFFVRSSTQQLNDLLCVAASVSTRTKPSSKPPN